MRYFFALAKNNRLFEVEEFSKFIVIGGKMTLDGCLYTVVDISIDLMNNKTHIYVK